MKDKEGQETGEVMGVDKSIRPEATLEGLSLPKPAFKDDGKLTAGNSSQI